MRCIVTGGAGFIGSHIQDRLISLGHTVGIIDNLRSGKAANLNPSSEFYNVDVRDTRQIPEIFSKFRPEVIFHLAAQNEVPYSMEHPLEDQDMNIVGMINLLQAALPHQSKIIYSNTGGALYGEVTPDQLPITEDQPIRRPTSFYGVSKGCAEMYLRLFGHIHNLPWVSLRYSNVYGPRQDGNREAGIVAIFTHKMLRQETPVINGNGGHTRDYVFVDDVVDANIAALNYRDCDYFNIATGQETSNQTVFDTLHSTLHSSLTAAYGPDRPGDPRRNCLSPAKAAKFLGWQPKTSFAQGVKYTIDYYLSLDK